MDDVPPHWLISALSKFASECMNHTGHQILTRVSIKTEMGMRMGIFPGTSMDVSTAAGRIEVYCESTPRMKGTLNLFTGEVIIGPDE